MSLRARILLGSLILVLLPLSALVLGIREEMSHRLTAQYTQRVGGLVQVIEQDLADRGEEIDGRLKALTARIADDNRFRLAAVEGLESQRPYLLDYAGQSMELMGLSMLQIQDSRGRILSSGHFRNEYDRLERALPRLLEKAPARTALVRARLPEGAYLSLARVRTFELGGRTFSVVGGITVGKRMLMSLARDRDIEISLLYPGGALSSDDSLAIRLDSAVRASTSEASEAGAEDAGDGASAGTPPAGTADTAAAPDSAATPDTVAAPPWRAVLPESDYLVQTVTLPFAAAGREPSRLSAATVLVSYPLAPLHRLLHNLDMWLAGVLVASFVGSLLIAGWLSARISRPIVDLARKTAALDLDHLEADFESRRRDEVGVLSRFLAALTDRLRRSAELLREAEQQATRGEMARQVNHDIRNGLTPIRHVFRHLAQVAEREPDRLGAVFKDRERAMDASIGYLEELAANYARISTRVERTACDLNETVRHVVQGGGGRDGVELRAELAPDLPPVAADPVSLRRVVENLVRNAWESLEEGGGRITVTTEPVDRDGGGRAVRLTVADTGVGMSPDQLERVFADFYTTKKSGAGLGLSIVRRLVSDLDGSVRAESEPGRGATFIVILPTAAAGRPAAPRKERSRA